MMLIDALRPDIRKDLERSGIAELVSVSVSAMADPDREEAGTIQVGSMIHHGVTGIVPTTPIPAAPAPSGSLHSSPRMRIVASLSSGWLSFPHFGE